MRFIAESSVFVLESQLFIQLLGVAMGSWVSPTFACLFVGILEFLMLLTWQDRGEKMPHMIRRFIDDVFFLWRHGEEELSRFTEHIISFHQTIKFEVIKGESYNFQISSINFLDLKIWIDSDYTQWKAMQGGVISPSILFTSWVHLSQHPLQPGV